MRRSKKKRNEKAIFLTYGHIDESNHVDRDRTDIFLCISRRENRKSRQWATGAKTNSLSLSLSLFYHPNQQQKNEKKNSSVSQYSSIYILVFWFVIPVPPIIEPFTFQDGLAEGMRTRTVCGVSRGDAPLTLRWLKDGEPLPLALGANVTFLDQYSSLLSIPSLSATHSGDYTCVATNPAAEFKYTATLQVKGIV